MIFRLFINSEEIGFCNVDTPEEALETLLDENATYYDEVMEKMRPTIYGYHAALEKKPDGEPGDFWEIKGYASADDALPAEVRKVNPPVDQLRRAKLKCPKCGRELEISKTDVNLDRNGLRVWVDCPDNVCPFSKVLELSLDDIIGIGRDPRKQRQKAGKRSEEQ